MKYELTEEYRDRYGLNQGERYWIDQAVDYYLRAITAELQADEEAGKPQVITSDYIRMLFDDINWKLDAWTLK
jgi:hypothetical protein